MRRLSSTRPRGAGSTKPPLGSGGANGAGAAPTRRLSSTRPRGAGSTKPPLGSGRANEAGAAPTRQLSSTRSRGAGSTKPGRQALHPPARGRRATGIGARMPRSQRGSRGARRPEDAIPVVRVACPAKAHGAAWCRLSKHDPARAARPLHGGFRACDAICPVSAVRRPMRTCRRRAMAASERERDASPARRHGVSRPGVCSHREVRRRSLRPASPAAAEGGRGRRVLDEEKKKNVRAPTQPASLTATVRALHGQSHVRCHL